MIQGAARAAQQVVLAPVPWVHLLSAQCVPELSKRVAFGSSSANVLTCPVGLPIYIHASAIGSITPHVAAWTGTLGAIVPAVQSGSRSGKHRDASVRPPTAEKEDEAFAWFFEVLGLRKLAVPRRLTEFTARKDGKGKPFMGDVPQWPVLAYLDC